MTVSLTVTSRGRRPLRLKRTTAAPVTNMARLESMNGAPRMAPTPIL